MRLTPCGRLWGVRTLLQARTVLSRGRGTMECAPRGLLVCCSSPTLLITLASIAPASGSWLNARPCMNLGLRLGNKELAHSTMAALGSSPCARASLQLWGRGGVSRSSRTRLPPQHRSPPAASTLTNDVLVRSIRSTELKPSRLQRDDNKQPDGATLDP